MHSAKLAAIAVIVTAAALPAQQIYVIELFIGEIRWFGFNFCPRGWFDVDG